VADALGLPAAMWTVAVLTFGSGLVVAVRMHETITFRKRENGPAINGRSDEVEQT
jgi:hypothetical protein